MPVFTFSGKTASGEKVQGERAAANKDGLASQLRRERITPSSIREKGKEFSRIELGVIRSLRSWEASPSLLAAARSPCTFSPEAVLPENVKTGMAAFSLFLFHRHRGGSDLEIPVT